MLAKELSHRNEFQICLKASSIFVMGLAAFVRISFPIAIGHALRDQMIPMHAAYSLRVYISKYNFHRSVGIWAQM